MNQIRVKRLLLAGLVTLVMWIVVEFLLEQVIGRAVFGQLIEDQWLQRTSTGDWTGMNYAVNFAIALVNTTLLMWLYASLRPMYGVGTKTALMTSLLVAIWVFSITVNGINLGLFPPQAGLAEAVYEAIELPIVMLVGAAVYEGDALSGEPGEE